MRSRRSSQEHTDAVARRLAELSAQLSASREPARAAEEIQGTGEVAGGVPLDRAVGDEWWSDHTRVTQRLPLSVVPPMVETRPGPGAPSAPAVDAEMPSRAHDPQRMDPHPLPVPGRHASRRPLAWVPDLVPAPLRGRIRLGSSQLAALAVLVAVGLAVTSWSVVHGDPQPPVPVSLEQPVGGDVGVAVLPPASDAQPAPDAAPGQAPPVGAGPDASAVDVTVDVAGKVRRPGIVVLDAGARVVDALEQAGGARAGVDLTSLNLARVLVDGEQIVVGTAGGAPAGALPPAAAAPGTTGAPTALVDLNLADQVLLETLPQVGPVTAGAIIAWRTEHGAFSAVTELLEVDGIGEATLAQLSPLVTV